MGFAENIPLGSRRFSDLYTTCEHEVQIWQELIMLRHVSRPLGISAKKKIAPWIDQAKVYYLDARKSEWRTGGLLYYYSFLNLAKAYLAAKRSVSAQDLKSISVYHGLSADPQTPNKIIDFDISIHPPLFRNKRNLFSTLYEKLIGDAWPHQAQINVRASDVLPYCEHLTAELHRFYQLNKATITCQSLIRSNAASAWHEINVLDEFVPVIQSHLPANTTTAIPYAAMRPDDFGDWLVANKRTKRSLFGTSLIRTAPKPIGQASIGTIINQVHAESNDLYSDYVLPFPVPRAPAYQSWHFIPRITLAGVQMRWHPLLSDYLFSFILSTILRYHPHLLPADNQDSFLAEAWCNQSASDALRYFLIAFTTPSIRMTS